MLRKRRLEKLVATPERKISLHSRLAVKKVMNSASLSKATTRSLMVHP